MLYVIIAILIICVIIIVSTYNSLIKCRNKVKEQWSQIEVQLERRFDLIPNLVETVKGYTKHEDDVLTKLAEIRTSWNNAKTIEEKGKLTNSLDNSIKSVFAVAESYPELKANENFLQLQNELKATEDKISNSRNSYNSVVNEYNTKIETIPTNFVANMFNFEKAELFKLENEEARNNIKVNF